MTNNLILLRHLTEIASSKRVPDGNKKKVYKLEMLVTSWGEYFLLFGDNYHGTGLKFDPFSEKF